MIDESVRIVCLVGSSRFKDRFHEVGERLEKSGALALMMSFFQHADGVPVSDAERAVLERVDRRRIDLADEVLVLDCPWGRCRLCKAPIEASGGGEWYTCECIPEQHRAPPWLRQANYEEAPYVGESTRKEIEYARSVGKPVRFLSEGAP